MRNPKSITIVKHGGSRTYYESFREGAKAVADVYDSVWSVTDPKQLSTVYAPLSPWNFSQYDHYVIHDGVPAVYVDTTGRYDHFRGSYLVLDECGLAIPKWKLRELLLGDSRFYRYHLGVFEMFREKRKRRKIWRRRFRWPRQPKMHQEYKNVLEMEVDPSVREYKIKIRRKRSDLPLSFWFNDDMPDLLPPIRSWKKYRKTQYRMVDKRTS